MKNSNSLIYKKHKVGEKETIYVSIRLNDECKNGHQDFAIGGDVYVTGKPKTDRNFIMGGCIHEEILKHFPEFAIFVRLHLCDYKGIPMHAIANGFYFLKQGFNKVKPDSPEFATEFCEYYRVTPEQFETLKTSETKEVYAYHLAKLGVFEQWEKEASEAIKLLEELTETKFVVDSKRTQRDLTLTPEQEKEIQQQIESGYFAPQKIAERRTEKRRQEKAAKIDKILEETEKVISEAKKEAGIKITMLENDFAINNIIYYKHSNTLSFNWKSYEEKLTAEEIERVKTLLSGHDINFETKEL